METNMKFFIKLFLLLSAISINSIQATSYAPVTLNDMQNSADLIIVGKFKKVEELDGEVYRTTFKLDKHVQKGSPEQFIEVVPFNMFKPNRNYLLFLKRTIDPNNQLQQTFEVAYGGFASFEVDKFENILVEETKYTRLKGSVFVECDNLSLSRIVSILEETD